MRGVGLGGLLLFAACDGVFNIRAITDGAPGPDAPRVCEAGTPFRTGQPVPIDGSYSVEAARFAPDRSYANLALCPASGAKLGCDLYLSQFSTETGQFTQHVKMTGVSSAAFYDSYPTFTPDGNFILFGSDRGGAVHLWIAAKTNGSFEAPALTQLALAGEQYANEPYLVGDGQTLYFGASLPGATDDWDVYRATGGPPGFSQAVQVAGTVSTADEQAPVVSADERELFIASNRHDPDNPNSLDIYATVRDAAALPFPAPVRVPELSQNGGNDWPVWLSPDGCDLYYINKMAGVSTLYVTQR